VKIAVFDTYVQRPDGRTMHFDILVQDDPASRAMEVVFAHGRRYLATKGIQDASLSAQEYRFCHIETAPPAVEQDVALNGFAIIEMANCD
jgi:hypothetical protein